MAATLRQRQKAAEVLREGGTHAQAAKAASVSLSTIKRWLTQPEFQAMISSSPDIRPGRPAVIESGTVEADSPSLRCRMWVALGSEGRGEVLGAFIPPTAYETAHGVVQVHVVPADAVDEVRAAIDAKEYPDESHYIPVPLSGLQSVVENLPLVCRLGSSDQRESLMAWLEVWTFVDEDGRTRTLAESLWDGQRRFLEALSLERHVVSIKARKVGLSTMVVAHAAWTARIRDVNASVHLLSHKEDAAKELLRSLRRGFDGLPVFLRLPLERQTSTVVAFAAGPGDTRSLKAFPATRNASIEATCSHLVLDEWAHTVDPEALWMAVEPTLAGRSSSALITTALAPGDFVHGYYLRSEARKTRHTAVFVSALERPDRSPEWMRQKRRQEGKTSCLWNYPLTVAEAFADASEPYFDPGLVEAAQKDALPRSPARPGDRYLTAWDLGRKDASVCVVLRAPGHDEAAEWHVVGYQRLVGEDWPAIQHAVEAMHADYPGPTVIEDNSIGPFIQNLQLPETAVIPRTTTTESKKAMLTEIEIRLQDRTLKIHREFDQLLGELVNYRELDTSITQDSVIALGLALSNKEHASSSRSGGGINRELLYAFNRGDGTPPPSWLDRQKITGDGPSWGLVKVVRDVSDPREISEYQADACTDELERMLAQGWKVKDPTQLTKHGLGLDDDGRLIEISHH